MKPFEPSKQVEAKRLAIIGSAKGGGALQIIDALQDSRSLVPVAVFDSDFTMVGKSILGIPVVDSSSEVLNHFENGLFDCVIIAIGNLEIRASLYQLLKSAGLPFANVIDSSAQIRSGVILGEGNVILGNVYIGPEVSIGNNCYIITNSVINHHSVIGDHCYLSSGVTLSGRVIVGNSVKFDMASVVKTGVKIGEGSTIEAGHIVAENTPA
ncbi:MAG: acetyltransferase [Verrucomicrobia bacterium]|nr:acetyltransferase [Verrucomicrobiota bacterium]